MPEHSPTWKQAGFFYGKNKAMALKASAYTRQQQSINDFVNNSKLAFYLMSDKKQPRLCHLRGWGYGKYAERTIKEDI